MFRPLLSALLSLALVAPAAAVENAPRLLVAISVDQFSGDLFNEYRAHFSGGLKRLLDGVVFPRAYQSHAATETCPGHSTLLTGARPARTGIIANRWIDPASTRRDKTVYCVEDETVAGTDSKHYVASLRHLRVPTLGDRMKRADPRTRVVSVAGKDRAALLLAGTSADETWWWGGKGFVASRGATPAPAVTRMNEQVANMLDQPVDALPLPDFCAARDYPVTLADGRRVGTGRFARAAGDADAFRVSPELDAATAALAAALVDALALGRGPQTDLLAVGLSATDLVGHAYGTAGAEMCLQMAALDRTLAALFGALDLAGIDYLVMLSADHGGHDAPERGRANAVPDDERVDAALAPEALNAALEKRTGWSGPLVYGTDPAGDFYLAPGLDAARRKRVGEELLALWRAHPQVHAVFTREAILAAPPPRLPPDQWTLLDEVRASFDPARSGDFYVLLRPRVTPIPAPAPGYIATHGSPWDYDRRVPLLFWRKGLAGFEQPNSVETVDILPTLAAQIGLAVSRADIDGRCLDLDSGDGDSCPPP